MSAKTQSQNERTEDQTKELISKLDRPVLNRLRIRKSASLRPLRSTSRLKSVRPERVTLSRRKAVRD